MDDIRLLDFHKYNDYLASFVKPEDYRYLQAVRAVEQIVKLGYRNRGQPIYSEEEFYERKRSVLDRLNPIVSTRALFSANIQTDDAVLLALAEREGPNTVQKISTIIFIQVHQRNGFDLSGYIDYEASLRHSHQLHLGATDWRAIFEGRGKLRPKSSDLSFYDWHKNYVSYKDSDNYRTVYNPNHGMFFIHKGDHKKIWASPKKTPFKNSSLRTMVHSDRYGFLIFYDHHVRKKV